MPYGPIYQTTANWTPPTWITTTSGTPTWITTTSGTPTCFDYWGYYSYANYYQTSTTTGSTMIAPMEWEIPLANVGSNPRQVLYESPPLYDPVAVAGAQRRDAARAPQRRPERARPGRLTAQDRAIELLVEMLTDAPGVELHDDRIMVRGSAGRRYCVHRNGQSGNVDWVDEDGQMQGRFCAHPGGGYLPDADAWLAQVLALQTDENAFLRVANVHRGHRPAGIL